MRWISLFLILTAGCANHRTRISVTYANHKPVVTVDFQPTETEAMEGSHAGYH